MKRIGKSEAVTAANGNGRDRTAVHTDWQVEESDVGTARQHYMGYNYRSYTFKREDVGKVIDVMTDGSGWTCWTIGSFWGTEPEPPTVVVAPPPAIASAPKIERMVIPVISTQHLSEEAALILGGGSALIRNNLIVATYPEGFFIYVMDDTDALDGLPQSIRDVAEWAKKNRFDWVRMDRDAEQVDGLTSYNW